MAMPRFAISDGVGGSPQPAAASRRLLQNLLALDASHPALTPRARAERLHDRLMQALNRQPLLEDAAATLITVEWSDNRLRLWHAGDSRGYRVHQGQAQRLTQDHTTIHMLQSEGWLDPAEAVALGDTRLANALDNLFVYSHYAEPPTLSVRSVELSPGDILLLVSDGVTSTLTDQQIASCLMAETLTLSARRLHAAVMATPAGDDFSAILIANESAAT
jgi:serine/threonine protein phosphatase PrpC